MNELALIVTGWTPIPHAYVFRPQGHRLVQVASLFKPGGEVLRSPCVAYVLRHPSEGTILIDTGFHPDVTRSVREDFGTRMGLLFRNLKPEDAFDEQLRGLGIEPGEVERVVMTHLHVDHTSGMRLLPNARFTCSRREWEAATARGAGGKGYVAAHLPPEERMDLLDFEESESHGPFTQTIDLLGDGSLRLISTPGHTPGHMSVLVRDQTLVIGDAVYTLRSLREEILPLLTRGDDRYLSSLKEIKAFAWENPEVTVVPSHDPEAWRAVPGPKQLLGTTD